MSRLSTVSQALVLVSNRWNSAITEYAIRLGEALKILNLDVQWIVKPDTPVAARLEQLKHRYHPCDFSVRQYGALARHLLVRPYPLIISCGGPELVAASLCALPGARLWRFFGYEPAANKLGGLRLKLSHQRVKAVITPSAVLKERLSGTLKPNLIHPVILGLDTKSLQRQSVTPPLRPPVLIFGRLDPVKGHREFIKIFARVLSQWNPALPRPVLKIVGLSANLNPTEIMQAATAAGLFPSDLEISEERVNDVPALLSQAAVGVIPSLGSEWICRVSEEFLLCGTPIVVSRAGSLAEVLFSGAGYQLENNWQEGAGVDALRHALEDFCQENSTAREQRAREAAQRFSLETMAEHLRLVMQASRLQVAAAT